jgi:hypothetical protein
MVPQQRTNSLGLVQVVFTNPTHAETNRTIHKLSGVFISCLICSSLSCRSASCQKRSCWPSGFPAGGFGEAFSKWFGRYKRDLGIDNPSSVFHSFRHGFKDALRAAGVNEDVNDALTGHSGGNAVARGYGWKDMVRRFGFPTLYAAVEKVRYPSLDLTALLWAPPSTGSSVGPKGIKT